MNWMSDVKLLLVGDSGVGKTMFLHRHSTGEFKSRRIPTLGVEVHPLRADSNFGPIQFNCWDFAGEGFHDDDYANAQCAIIMFDVTSRLSYQNVPNWYRDIRRVCANIPIVLCSNKVDVERHKVEPKHITFHREKHLKYVEMSVKANYNIETPLLWITRKLVGYDFVRFLEAPSAPPMPIFVDPAQIALLEAAMLAAASVPLPDEDDDI